MNEDRIEGAARKVVGTVQQGIGEVANDEQLEAKGRINQAIGTVQGGYGKVREKVKGLIEEAPSTAKDAIDTGKDYYRRGSAAVTRTMGDNTALVLLGVGVAGAALGWLAFNKRRRDKKDA